MKAENERLGRCRSCCHWKSATELLAERAGPTASPSELDAARLAVRQELSPNNLDVASAESRGWCLSAESGTVGTSTLLALNMVEHTPVRMVTLHSHGCLNHVPRPRQAMKDPPPDFSMDEALGRCAGCNSWSDAENEAKALHAQARYVNPAAKEEDAEREAMALLSPPPLDPATARLRGWCKAASFAFPYANNLVVDPVSGALGGLITGRDYACVRYTPMSTPGAKTRPDWRILANRTLMHVLGRSASLDDLLLSYMDPATVLDANHPLSPLHESHPLNIRNPKSLYYNPKPAFAAYVLNPSIVNTLSDKRALMEGVEAGRPVGVVDANRPRVTMQFGSDPSRDLESANRQLLAQARLADDFATRTVRLQASPAPEPPQRSVKLTKPSDRRTPVKRAPSTGFIDRRRVPT